MFVFPGGEVHFNKKSPPSIRTIKYGQIVIVYADIDSSDKLIELFLYTDYLKQDEGYSSGDIALFIPYMPYARMDRLNSEEGEPFSLKTVANLINAQQYASVTVLDPHSDVVAGVLNNIYIKRRDWLKKIKDKWDCIICPDSGARKKAAFDAKVTGLPIVYADKVRDTATGKLSGFEVHQASVPARCLIIDDICDGGGTFTGTAEVLKQKGAVEIGLAVTHGIFSKGYNIPNIDFIYTTNSRAQKGDLPQHVKVYDIWSK